MKQRENVLGLIEDRSTCHGVEVLYATELPKTLLDITTHIAELCVTLVLNIVVLLNVRRSANRTLINTVDNLFDTTESIGGHFLNSMRLICNDGIKLHVN